MSDYDIFEYEQLPPDLTEQDENEIAQLTAALDIIKELKTENEKRRAALGYSTDLFESLTPGGSEFSGDPDRCAEWVRERLATTTKQVIKRKEAENQLTAALDTIKALTATLNNQEDALSGCSESFAFVRGENDRLTAENEKLREAVNSKNQQLEDALEMQSDYREENEELTKWNERYKESNDKLVKMHQDCSDWVSRLIADNTGLENEIAMLREKNAELQAIADRVEVGY